MLESSDAGDAGMLGMLVKLAYSVFQAKDAGCRDMFWGPNVWAGLRAGDAGKDEEELGVQPSAVYPTGRVALALRARRHTVQLDFGNPQFVGSCPSFFNVGETLGCPNAAFTACFARESGKKESVPSWSHERLRAEGNVASPNVRFGP